MDLVVGVNGCRRRRWMDVDELKAPGRRERVMNLLRSDMVLMRVFCNVLGISKVETRAGIYVCMKRIAREHEFARKSGRRQANTGYSAKPTVGEELQSHSQLQLMVEMEQQWWE